MTAFGEEHQMMSEPGNSDPSAPPAPFEEMSVPLRVAASLLGTTVPAVERLIGHGHLDCVRTGRWRYVPLPSLFTYRRHTEEAGQHNRAG